MKQITTLIFCLFCLSQGVFCQQYPLFTNYVINGFGFNPAVAGTHEYVDARFIYRTQWVGIQGAPVTDMAWINGKLSKTSPFGLGAYMYNDQAGNLKKTGFTGVLSYAQKLGEKTTLNFGIAGGYYKVNISDTYKAQNEGDPTLQGAVQGMSIPDLSIGVYLKADDFFAGLSVPQIYQKKLDFDPTLKKINITSLVRQYYALGGYTAKVAEKLEVEPSVLLKSSPNVNLQVDASARLIYNKMFWIGASYRSEDAITAMVGVDMPKFMVAYSYDVTTSHLSNGSSGSHEITLGLKFGGKCADKDGDGVCDKDDKCPDEPGDAEHNGCPPPPKAFSTITKIKRDTFFPDRDGDGIRDDIDKCPDIPGSARNEGCPLSDRDKDGILDEYDRCPDVWGPISNGGCPLENDRDKDGVPDNEDACPDVPGPKSNNGCPLNGDRDGDGVPDAIDKCPNTYGPKENDGCPIPKIEDKQVLSLAIRNLYFDTDKYAVRPAAFRNLNDLAELLRRRKDWKVGIVGHADVRGNQEHNLQLSKHRAEAVKNYLISRGVDPNLILLEFYGATMPAMAEQNQTAYQMNRRVEMQFLFN